MAANAQIVILCINRQSLNITLYVNNLSEGLTACLTQRTDHPTLGLPMLLMRGNKTTLLLMLDSYNGSPNSGFSQLGKTYSAHSG